MIKELESVVLTTDLPEHGLTSGDIGTVVLIHEGGRGFKTKKPLTRISLQSRRAT